MSCVTAIVFTSLSCLNDIHLRQKSNQKIFVKRAKSLYPKAKVIHTQREKNIDYVAWREQANHSILRRFYRNS